MRRFTLPLLLTLTFILAACAPAQVAPLPFPTSPQNNPQSAPISNTVPTPTDDPAILPTLFPNMRGNKEMTRMDQQGAVVMEITPLNLGTPADTLEFDVSMNTHSVDLSMDLAKLATLTTDTGVSIQAVSWEAPRGGHHVQGKLIFPTLQDGQSIYGGVKKITLAIINVDAPSRIFEWELK